MSAAHWLPIVVVGLGLGALGCEPKLASVVITEVTSPPLSVKVSGNAIEMPEGIAVAVDIVGKSDHNDDETQIHATSLDSSKLGIEVTTTDQRFILYGNAVGTGQLEFTADNTEGSVDVPFTVIAQP